MSVATVRKIVYRVWIWDTPGYWQSIIAESATSAARRFCELRSTKGRVRVVVRALEGDEQGFDAHFSVESVTTYTVYDKGTTLYEAELTILQKTPENERKRVT